MGNSPSSGAGASSPSGGFEASYCPSLPEAAWVRVAAAIKHIEAIGALNTEGIYRVSGLNTDVARGVAYLKEGGSLQFNELGIHEWAAAIKGCLRQHEPLTSYRLYDALVDAGPASMPAFLSALPREWYNRLKVACKHLVRVAGHSHINLMTASNLAKIWGGILARRDESGAFDIRAELQAAARQYKIACALLEFFATPASEVQAPRTLMPLPPIKEDRAASPSLRGSASASGGGAGSGAASSGSNHGSATTSTVDYSSAGNASSYINNNSSSAGLPEPTTFVRRQLSAEAIEGQAQALSRVLREAAHSRGRSSTDTRPLEGAVFDAASQSQHQHQQASIAHSHNNASAAGSSRPSSSAVRLNIADLQQHLAEQQVYAHSTASNSSSGVIAAAGGDVTDYAGALSNSFGSTAGIDFERHNYSFDGLAADVAAAADAALDAHSEHARAFSGAEASERKGSSSSSFAGRSLRLLSGSSMVSNSGSSVGRRPSIGLNIDSPGSPPRTGGGGGYSSSSSHDGAGYAVTLDHAQHATLGSAAGGSGGAARRPLPSMVIRSTSFASTGVSLRKLSHGNASSTSGGSAPGSPLAGSSSSISAMHLIGGGGDSNSSGTGNHNKSPLLSGGSQLSELDGPALSAALSAAVVAGRPPAPHHAPHHVTSSSGGSGSGSGPSHHPQHQHQHSSSASSTGPHYHPIVAPHGYSGSGEPPNNAYASYNSSSSTVFDVPPLPSSSSGPVGHVRKQSFAVRLLRSVSSSGNALLGLVGGSDGSDAPAPAGGGGLGGGKGQ